jgi:hypothetical protein
MVLRHSYLFEVLTIKLEVLPINAGELKWHIL